MYDLVIKNASVIDGTGAEPFVGDVAIRDGRIAAVGDVTGEAARVMDVQGLTLTPGFIDSHSHGDYHLLRNPDHSEAVEQGITFGVAGQCGGSVAPTADQSFAQLMQQLRQRPLGTGYGLLVGHGTLRILVAGRENRALTDGELGQMIRLLEQCMDEGAMGLSLGLTYPPGSYADREELAALAKVVGKRSGILVAHIRNESDDLLPSVEEMIYICRQGGCRGVISHLKAADRVNHGKVSRVLAMLEQARQQGVEIYADAYPYCASATTLLSRFVPRQFHPPGTTNVAALLDDPALCEKIKAWARKKWGDDLSWVLVTVCPSNPEYCAMTVNQIADAMGMTDRYEAVFALLRKNGNRCRGCFTMMDEADVTQALAHPWVMVGTDSSMGSPATYYHPRRVAAFPRVLGKYVRREAVTTLQEMIRKMTSLPAQVYGLTHKGRIAVGMDADLCIFDPETIEDTADYVNCCLPNRGIHYVLIGGQVVVEQGRYNGVRAGSIYRMTGKEGK